MQKLKNKTFICTFEVCELIQSELTEVLLYKMFGSFLMPFYLMCYYYFASSFSLRLSVFHNRLEKKVWGIRRVIKHLSGNQDLTETELLVTSVFFVQQNWQHWQISNHCAKNSYNLFLIFIFFFLYKYSF